MWPILLETGLFLQVFLSFKNSHAHTQFFTSKLYTPRKKKNHNMSSNLRGSLNSLKELGVALCREWFKKFNYMKPFIFSIFLQFDSCLVLERNRKCQQARSPSPPFLKPALRLLQLGLQVPHCDLLLLQRSQVLLRIWRLDTMIFSTRRVPARPPETIQGHKMLLSVTSFSIKSKALENGTD